MNRDHPGFVAMLTKMGSRTVKEIAELREARDLIRKHDAAAWAKAGRGQVWEVPFGYVGLCDCGECRTARRTIRRHMTGQED